MINILVTNGEYQNTLAVIQNIKYKANITVLSGTSKYKTRCYYSKYCNHLITSDINRDECLVKNDLIELLKSGKYDIFIPVGLNYCEITAKYYDEISKYVKVMAPSFNSFTIASHKNQTMDFAEKNKVPIPKTVYVNSEIDIRKIQEYPAVLKSAEGTGGFIYYCNSHDELNDKYMSLSQSDKKSVLCQEYISGFGCGYFGLYEKGQCLSCFMHRRVKEYPPTGGPSVVAESYYDVRLKELGDTLCSNLGWTGPIMCEFKYDSKSQDYKLIEINPKLWGSLDLTIQAGINIPNMIIDYLQNNMYPTECEQTHIFFRWILPGELLHLMKTFSFENLRDFVKFKKDQRTNITWRDPGVIFFLIGLTAYKFIKIMLQK